MAVLADISIYGYENSDGSAVEEIEDRAIGNALVMWLSSKRGDFMMNPEDGGILDSVIFKNMSDLNMELLHFKIQTEIIKNFDNLLSVNAIQLTPNYTERYLEIDIMYQSKLSGNSQNVMFYLDLDIRPEKFVYEDVLYVGENLENFVLVKKSSMQGKLLSWSIEEDSFVWGDRFRFKNLHDTDENFSLILALCNDIV